VRKIRKMPRPEKEKHPAVGLLGSKQTYRIKRPIWCPVASKRISSTRWKPTRISFAKLLFLRILLDLQALATFPFATLGIGGELLDLRISIICVSKGMRSKGKTRYQTTVSLDQGYTSSILILSSYCITL
jgi:hypothetical protein